MSNKISNSKQLFLYKLYINYILQNFDTIKYDIYELLNHTINISNKNILSDFSLAILYIIMEEIPQSYEFFIKTGKNQRYFVKIENQQDQKTIEEIDELRNKIYYDYKGITRNFCRIKKENTLGIEIAREDLSTEKELFRALNRYRDKLMRKIEYPYSLSEYMMKKDHNFIYSQKISSKTGLRDLIIRLLSVLFQICFYDDYTTNKYKFSELIYNILIYLYETKYYEYIQSNNNLEDIDYLQNITTLEIYKLIKEIDINNTNQKYEITFFSLIFDSEIKKSDSVFKDWFNGISYKKIYDFICFQNSIRQ